MIDGVVITGIGVSSSIAGGAREFWRTLIEGRTGLGLAAPDQAATGVRVVGQLRGDSGAAILQGGSVGLRRVFNRQFELLSMAAAMASLDSELETRPLEDTRLGLVVAMGGIDQYTEDLVAIAQAAGIPDGFNLARFVDLARGLYPLRRLCHLPNMGTSLVSIQHHARGPSLTLVGSITDGLLGILQGFSIIRSGRADAVLCGAADSRLSPFSLRLLRRRWHLSELADPEQACRPFDHNQTGIVVGEAGVVLVLESRRSAEARAVRIYAELLAGSFANSCEGAMRQVLEAAGGAIPDVVVAHGEGSRDADHDEAFALQALFASHASPFVTSIKAAVGHTMTAAGAFNAATACLVLSTGQVPAIRTLDDPILSLRFVHRQSFNLRAERVLVNVMEPRGAAASILFRSPQQ